MEYVSLAKTRLADLKVKIHGVGPLLNRSRVFFHTCVRVCRSQWRTWVYTRTSLAKARRHCR